MFQGCFTALITPFRDGEVDWNGLERLIGFQVENGVDGVLAAGTTGESPTLSWEEHNRIVESVTRACKGRCLSIAGTGSNNTSESMESTEHASRAGADAALLVDPYYNGPSSLEIRREYVGPLAARFKDLAFIPYVIPGRTGAQLLPEDLAILHRDYPNVRCVKEATGDMENMRRTRACCGAAFSILSGDDDKTLAMMTDAAIQASGVISVASNIAPKGVADMVRLLREGKRAEAERLALDLKPLFEIVTVKTQEETPFGPVPCKARNPLGVKTLMAVLGMPSGACRPPLGKMTRKGLEVVLGAGRAVWERDPALLRPIAACFDVDIEARLYDNRFVEGLFYETY